MRKISFWLFMLVFAAAFARAQDAATQQQLDKLAGQIQDLTEMQRQQGKQIADLQKQVADLADKLNQPAANNYASADDLKQLATQIQEVDKKRLADNEKVTQTLEKMARLIASSGGRKSISRPTSSDDNSHKAGNNSTTVPQKGYNYKIQPGDYLSTIAKAYNDQGVKVTVKDILAANPGLDPKKMIPGATIFIPDPNAK